MHEFLDELRKGLGLCHVQDERLLVAVSGGADSVALLLGLVELANQFSVELVVGHLNHRLRGSASDSDAAWVAELSTSLNLCQEIGVVSSDLLNAESTSMEETARKCRYRFLGEAASKFACTSIVLAHTAEDQAETVLHHLLRGTGLTGLRGMASVRTAESGHRIVRPLLAVRRATLEDYLNERRQLFRSDATNHDLAMTRNRLRHVILPLIREQVNPQVDAAICRLAEQAAEIDGILLQLALDLLDRSLKDVQADVCRLDISRLTDQPKHLVRQMFRELWVRQKWSLQSMGYEQWNRLAETLSTRETITLPNRIEARFHSERLMVLRRL